ncbi:MAG: hypothetical protein SFU84_02790 [Gemmatimonadales bacterium]|nr:hypothetical protein [Gemmatimonadales bacterium]
MPGSPFTSLRRRLALVGGRPASLAAEAAQGRRDQAGYRPSRLLEGTLAHHALGEAVPWTEPVAFLDGTQHVELLGYVGTLPLVAAVVRAAVRQRDARRMTLAVQSVRRVVIAHEAALAVFGAALDGHDVLALDGDDAPHPIRDVERAHALVDRTRGALELAVAREYRRLHPDAWLLVDGTLTASPDWSRDPHMLGVVKSHAVLPFEGEALERYLTLPYAHRTSLFQPGSRDVAPVYAWGLRLHPFAGQDLFHGLVRIEAAATEATVANVDRLSRHLLAERAPRSADPRADRLLYGIHDVERFLRAQGG